MYSLDTIRKASHLCYGANEFKCVWLAFNQFKCNQRAYLCEIVFIYCVIHMPTTLVMTTQQKEEKCTPMCTIHTSRQDDTEGGQPALHSSGLLQQNTHTQNKICEWQYLVTHTIPCAHSQCLLLASSFMASALCSIHVCRRLGETS